MIDIKLYEKELICSQIFLNLFINCQKKYLNFYLFFYVIINIKE